MGWLYFVTDRFNEFDLFAIVLGIYAFGGLIGYPILQALAIIRMRGWWRWAGFLPLPLILIAVVVAAGRFAQGSAAGLVYVLTAAAVAFLYLSVLCLACWWRRPAVQKTV